MKYVPSILKSNKLAVYSLVFLLTQILLGFFMGKIYFFPSKYVFATEGDGGVIYYNMIYHALYGDGFLLKNMNYPRYESIFMTDGQASLSILFSLFKGWNPETVVGLTHMFLYLMFGCATIYAYKTLELLGIRKWLAILGALSMVFLSPLTVRLQGAGHLGLFYPFVFTYCFYFFCKTILVKENPFWNGIKVALVLIFFGLNNIYLIGINAAFLLCGVLPLFFYPSLKRQVFKILLPTLFSLLVVFLFIHFTDIGSDRIEVQWGYEANRTTIAGMLYPPVGLSFELLSLFFNLSESQMESWLHFGLSPWILILCFPFLVRLKRIRKSIRTHAPIWISFLVASVILLIYSSAILYRIPFFKEHVFHQFSLATMFKASGRFSYPVYFAVSIGFIFALDQMMHYKKVQIMAFALLLIWILEINMYLSHHAFKEPYVNPFTAENLSKYKEEMKELTQIEAIYTLPVMVAWNDKFHTFLYNDASFQSRMISLATGIPMINSTLSRLGVSDATRAIQFASNPLIKKKITKDLKSGESILLVALNDFKKYTEGEKDLIVRSKKIHSLGRCDWRTIEVDNCNNNELQKSARAEILEAKDSVYTNDASFFKLAHFDDRENDLHFTPPGALEISEDQLILETLLPDTVSGGYEISLYCHVDNKMFGNPSFLVNIYGKDEAEIIMHRSFSFDNYIDWVRVWGWIDIPKGSTKLTISAVSINQPYVIDDISIRRFESKLIDGRKGFYNNFRIN